jgi:hypothetical protein
MSDLSEKTIEAMESIKIFLKVGEWDFKENDAGKLLIKLNGKGDTQAIVDHVFLTVVRAEENQYCTSLKKLLPKGVSSDIFKDVFTLPLPVKLAEGDKVRFFIVEGQEVVRQFTVHLNQ